MNDIHPDLRAMAEQNDADVAALIASPNARRRLLGHLMRDAMPLVEDVLDRDISPLSIGERLDVVAIFIVNIAMMTVADTVVNSSLSKHRISLELFGMITRRYKAAIELLDMSNPAVVAVTGDNGAALDAALKGGRT